MPSAASARSPDPPPHAQIRGAVADALSTFWRSSRLLVRQARGRYITDLLKWHHRDAFEAIWSTVDSIPGWFYEGNAAVLYELMRDHPPATIVEIGSYLGRSTIFFALALAQVSPSGCVTAVDPHTGDRQQLQTLSTDHLATFDLFRQHCRAAGVEHLIEPRVANSLDVAADWSRPVDLLYVDGWHSYDAVIADGEAWLTHLAPGGVVVFDDYATYPEVREAVDDLARRGLYRLWGSVLGQAIGGTAALPSPAVRRAMLLSGSSTRHLRFSARD